MGPIYLAARYSRRLELCGYRDVARRLGLDVQARWLDGAHQIATDGAPLGDGGEALVEGGTGGDAATVLRRKFLHDDMEDVSAAHVIVSFTEPPRGEASRGGRHVEFGIALTTGARLMIVGPRENLFHWHERVEQFEHFDEALAALLGGAVSGGSAAGKEGR